MIHSSDIFQLLRCDENVIWLFLFTFNTPKSVFSETMPTSFQSISGVINMPAGEAFIQRVYIWSLSQVLKPLKSPEATQVVTCRVCIGSYLPNS